MKFLFAGVSGLALLATSPAYAVLTPADVTDRLEAMAALADGAIQYDLETREDGSVVLRDILILDLDDKPLLRQTQGEIVFAPILNDDFEVDVQGLEALSFDLMEDGDQIGEVSITHDDYTYQMRGSAELVESVYTVSRATVDMSNDGVADMPTFTASLIGEGVTSETVNNFARSEGSMSTRIERVTTESLTSQAQSGVSTRALSVYEDTAYQAEWAGMPLAERLAGLRAEELPPVLKQDSFAVSGTSGQTRSASEMTNRGGTTILTDASTGASAFNAELTEGQLTAQISGEGLAVTLAGTALPFPKASVSLAGLDTSLSIPVMVEKGTANGAYSLRLDQLSVSDNVWSMVDPQGQLPRDPADLVLDLAFGGQFEDGLFAQMSEIEQDISRLKFESLDINELSLSAIGVDLVADGAFTFDNSQGETVPQGSMNAEVSGLDGVIETLAGMGVLPPEIMMSARMMMGLMLVPGDRPDTYTSVIEVAPDGTVSANGVPLQ